MLDMIFIIMYARKRLVEKQSGGGFVKMQCNVLANEKGIHADAMENHSRHERNYMFYLDFFHGCYSISESAMFQFSLSETKFQTLEDMFSSFVWEEDLPYVLRGFAQLRHGCKKKEVLEFRCHGKHGDMIWVSCSCEAMEGSLEQWSVIVGTIKELEKKKSEPTIFDLKADTEFISDFCTITNGEEHKTGFVMKLGVDNIKEINEKHGRHVAEKILQCTFQCILRNVDDRIQVYKTGSEKFILFECSGGMLKDAERLYRNIKEEINQCNEQIDFHVFYTVSAGAAAFDSYQENYIELCKKVDFAFNTARRKGKNEVVLYEQKQYEQYIKRLDIEEKLRQDVKNDFCGFEVYYQPIVNMETEQITGAEALLRWKCEEYGNISPAEFIPILEESGLIIPVGRWVMKRAVKQCKEWQEQAAGFRMNINVSYIQLKKSDVAFDVIHNLEENELDSKYVLFELTESGFVETDSTIRHIIKSFQKKKIKLGLDDFGTGYSNLCYLNDLKVYIIKIDRTFVMKALKSTYHYKLLKHIIDMAHSIQLKVCIEGIEEKEELNRIRELNPDYIQGYYYGKPADSETFYQRNLLHIIG